MEKLRYHVFAGPIGDVEAQQLVLAFAPRQKAARCAMALAREAREMGNEVGSTKLTIDRITVGDDYIIRLVAAR